MSVYGHVAVGAALGSLAPHPAVALALGAAAHIPADLVSHRDFNRAAELLMAAAALVLYTWLGGLRLSIALGAVGGALPDVESLCRVGLRGGVKLFPSHSRLLRHGDARPAWDAVVQLAVVVTMAAWVVWAPAFW
ncbi:MAG: hypothetical protein GTN49_12015 [candidate division Zixibacteria bacterium]|nr:hypothetical protein [candidate division Zixibacteria bacterium]